MRLTVLGGCGAWPAGDQGCSGYLVEHEGFHLLLDPGYATLPRLLEDTPAERVDAVVISHGHPDHCAELNPLLRARVLGRADAMPPVLPVHAPRNALDAVLALDDPHMLAGSYTLPGLTPGSRFEVGPFQVDTWALPHFVPNVGVRLTAAGHVLAYTGDTGPSAEIVTLAREADVLLAEATFPEHILPEQNAAYLSTARQAGEYAAEAGVGRLVLTHLWPGTDRSVARDAARGACRAHIDIATPGMTIEPG